MERCDLLPVHGALASEATRTREQSIAFLKVF